MVEWKVTEQEGITSTITAAAFYVPKASVQLYSPQFHFKESLSGSLTLSHLGTYLELLTKLCSSCSHDIQSLSFPFNRDNNLPMILPSKHPHFMSALYNRSSNNHSPYLRDLQILETLNAYAPEEEMSELLAGDSSSNLSSAQREPWLLHNKIGDIGLKRL